MLHENTIFRGPVILGNTVSIPYSWRFLVISSSWECCIICRLLLEFSHHLLDPLLGARHPGKVLGIQRCLRHCPCPRDASENQSLTGSMTKATLVWRQHTGIVPSVIRIYYPEGQGSLLKPTPPLYNTSPTIWDGQSSPCSSASQSTILPMPASYHRQTSETPPPHPSLKPFY